MLYAINGSRVEGYDEGQAPIIYLVSSVERVAASRVTWLFTEGHAEIAFSDYFDDLADLDKIDWNIMRSRYWNDTDEAPDRKRKRQAEFLVHQFFPWELVEYIGVSEGKIERIVREMLENSDHVPDVGIERNWYY